MQGALLSMELDTGASKSVISEKTYRSTWPHTLQLVPFALQARVERELDRLQQKVSVQFSDWGAPIVLVVKIDGLLHDSESSIQA